MAVTAAKETGTEGGLGLFVGPVVLGSSGKSGTENSKVDRIKFEVAVSYPKIEKKKKGGG